jgi:hypothetical protein
VFKDGDYNNISLTILEYYNTILQGVVIFLEDEHFQNNLENHFINNLEWSVRDMFEESCTNHLTISGLSWDTQL